MLTQTCLVQNELIGSTCYGCIHVVQSRLCRHVGSVGSIGSVRGLRLLSGLSQNTLANDIDAQLKLIAICRAVSTPIILGIVPFHEVTATNVLDVVQTVAQADQLPLIVLLAQIHAGIAVCQSNVLATVGEAVGAVAIYSYGPGFGIAVAGQSIILNSQINALIIEGLCIDLACRQRLAVSRCVDDHLITGLQILIVSGQTGNAGLLRLHGNIRRITCLGDKLKVELGLALVLCICIGNVVDAGSAGSLVNGSVVQVCTQIVLGAVDIYGIDAGILRIGPVNAGSGSQLRTYLILQFTGILIGNLDCLDLDVGFGLTVQEVEAYALLLGLFHEYVNTLLIGAGIQVVAVGNSTIEVDVLTQRGQAHLHLVSGVLLQGTHVDLHNTAALDPLIQRTTGAELQLAVVVHDLAGNGDLISYTNLGGIVTLHAVALDLSAANQHGNGNILILRAVSIIHADDLAGQGGNVSKLLAFLQLLSITQYLILVRGGLLRHTAAAYTVGHLTTGIKLDGAVVVLDNAGNGNGIAYCNILNTLALQTVAQDGILAVAFHLDDNRDVLVAGIVGRINCCDLTGQGHNIR